MRLGSQAATQSEIDLSPYVGRWVALIRGRVAGVGMTAREARLAARRSRPREEPALLYVTDEDELASQRVSELASQRVNE